MTRSRLLCLILTGILTTGVALADDLYVGTSYNSGFSVSIGGTSTVESGGPEMTSTLDGQSLAWMYCIGLFTDIPVGTNYDDTVVTSNGTIGTTTVNDAGQIAWLLDNYAAAAENSTTLQDALQVAIWTVEYNGDGTGTAAGEPVVTGVAGQAYYTEEQAELTALGWGTGSVQSASLSTVLWIDPKNSSSTVYQAQVGPGPATVPETNSPLELLTMAAGVGLALGTARLWRRSPATKTTAS